ncbi:hypothetical protein AL522_00765 (plasmid) [Pantoea vagans]|nr:hypothetical protein AL522_00765 [Pantoea vagans]
MLAFTPAGALSAFLRPEGRFRHLSLLKRLKILLMISAHLHGYAVRALIERLMHADVGNVRFWHGADIQLGIIRCKR